MLLGFGLFNTVEGLINHHLLGTHYVNELVGSGQWLYWDLGFIIWGVAMIAAGWWMLRQGRKESALAVEGNA
jgi:uncharacterized membrane protein